LTCIFLWLLFLYIRSFVFSRRVALSDIVLMGPFPNQITEVEGGGGLRLNNRDRLYNIRRAAAHGGRRRKSINCSVLKRGAGQTLTQQQPSHSYMDDNTHTSSSHALTRSHSLFRFILNSGGVWMVCGCEPVGGVGRKRNVQRNRMFG
jgi:hypothetical protein